MARKTITQAAVEKLQRPEPRPDGRSVQIDYRDSILPGFGVRVTSSGTRTFFLIRTLNGKRARWTIGRVGEITLADAREKARRYVEQIRKGLDPEIAAKRAAAAEQAQRAELAANTFASVRKKFLAQHGKNLRPGTLRGYRSFLEGVHLADWNDRPLASLTRREIVAKFDAIAEGTPVMARRGLSCLKVLVSWALDQEIIDTDITARVRKPGAEASRDRVLSDAEIKALWTELRSSAMRAAPLMSMLLLTGQRREEITGLRWNEVVDLDGAEPRIEIPGDRMKNGLLHVVPLSSAAAEIVRAQPRGDGYVFPSVSGGRFRTWDKAKRALDARVKFAERWTVHDLRRTVVTGLDNLGIAPYIVEAVVAHVGGGNAGVAGVPNRGQYLGERRVALQRWADHIQALVNWPAASNDATMRP